MLRRAWRIFAAVETSFWLLLLVSATLACGAYAMKAWPTVFQPLNNLLLQDWYDTVGKKHWEKIWWLCLLFLLLLLLGVNTAVCTWSRLAALLARRRSYDRRAFLLRISPSIIHLCFLAVLTGHLLSEVSGYNRLFTVQQGQTLHPSEELSLTVLEVHTEKYSSPEMLAGRVKNRSLLLHLHARDAEARQEVRYLEPILWKGYTFHLKMTHSEEGAPQAKLQVRQDPGLLLIGLAFGVMLCFLAWYFAQYPEAAKHQEIRAQRQEVLNGSSESVSPPSSGLQRQRPP